MSLASKFDNIKDEMPVTRAMAAWDGQFTTDAWDRLREVMGKDFFSTHRGDGSGRIRPSSIGNVCPRPALLSFHGMASDPDSKSSRAIMDAGTWRHYYWQLAGLSAGWLDDIEVPIEYKPWLLKGSADGVGADVGIFEFKSTNSQKMSKVKGNGRVSQYKADEAHLKQVQAYLKATGLKKASIVYEDRAYLSFIEIRVSATDDAVNDLEMQFSGWIEHIENGTYPPILPKCWEQTGGVYQYCHWKEACFDVG